MSVCVYSVENFLSNKILGATHVSVMRFGGL